MKFIISNLISLSAFFALMFLASNVHAATTCRISSSPGIGFGSYDVFTIPPSDSVGTITILCNGTTPWATIAIGQSPNSGGFNPRKMRKSGGTDLLDYNLFTSATRDVVWGDGTASTRAVVVHAFRDTPLPITIYGRIPPGQDVSVGFYSESLTATITP